MGRMRRKEIEEGMICTDAMAKRSYVWRYQQHEIVRERDECDGPDGLLSKKIHTNNFLVTITHQAASSMASIASSSMAAAAETSSMKKAKK